MRTKRVADGGSGESAQLLQIRCDLRARYGFSWTRSRASYLLLERTKSEAGTPPRSGVLTLPAGASASL